MKTKRKVETRAYIQGDVNFPVGMFEGPNWIPGKAFMRKEDLEDGAYYYGHCRNASCAKWRAVPGEFVYVRHKFGSSFDESINYPTDDDHSDVFTPLFKCYPVKSELVHGDEQDE